MELLAIQALLRAVLLWGTPILSSLATCRPRPALQLAQAQVNGWNPLEEELQQVVGAAQLEVSLLNPSRVSMDTRGLRSPR